MPTFSYLAYDEDGRRQRGHIDADSRKQALQFVRQQKQTPIKLHEATSAQTNASTRQSAFSRKERTQETSEENHDPEQSPPHKKKAFQSPDKVAHALLAKLYQLHKSGMPIGDCVRMLHQRSEEANLKKISGDIWQHISEGHTLASAMRQHQNLFEPSAPALVEAGEATGNLVDVLAELIQQIEARMSLRKKIIEGLSYPALLCTMAMGVVALLLFYLMPKIESMMQTMGGELSLPAKILTMLSGSLLAYGPILLALLLAVGAFVIKWRKNEKGRKTTDDWLLRIPIISSIVLNTEWCRVTNLMATMLNSGVPVTESLRLCARAIQNAAYQARFNEAARWIAHGASLSAAFRKYNLLPPMDIDMLQVGEVSNTSVDSLNQIHTEHQQELDLQLKRLTRAVAGIALGVAFLLILLVILSIVLSVMDLSQNLTAR